MGTQDLPSSCKVTCCLCLGTKEQKNTLRSREVAGDLRRHPCLVDSLEIIALL
jgi:hypothetical protein